MTTVVAGLGGVLLLVATPLMQARLDTLTQRARLDGEQAQQEESSLRLLVGADRALPLVREVNDRALLGIHPSIPLPPGANSELPVELPTYVSRDVDTDMHSALRRASLNGGFILLVGPAAAGKTRCAYEAVNAVLPDWRMCMPSSAEQLTALVNSGSDLTRTVVWLNETQIFIGPGQLKLETVRRILLDRTRPVVLVGTMNSLDYERMSGLASLRDGQEIDRDAREILRLARQFTISEFSPSEQARARDLADADPRLAEALAQKEGARLTEALAAAPELIHRWEQAADPFGAAVVSAAVDARLCGHPEPLPARALEVLCAAHLSRSQRIQPVEDWFDRAMEWACRPVRGAASLLAPDATEIGHLDGYRVTDILVQRAQNRSHLAITIPESQWTVLIENAALDACLAIGSTAHSHDLPSIAELAWKRAANGGNLDAAKELGLLLIEQGKEHEGSEWLRRAANGGNIDAAADLGLFLIEQGEATEGHSWLERAAGSDHRALVAMEIGLGLITLGKTAEGRAWLDRAVDDDDRLALSVVIGCQLIAQGEAVEGRAWLERAVEKSDEKLTLILVVYSSLVNEDLVEEGRAWLEHFTAHVTPGEAAIVGTSLISSGETDEGRAWLERAVAAGEGVSSIGLQLLKMGITDEGRAWLERAVAAGEEVSSIGLQLLKMGITDE
ncbi:hypothetical protein ACFYZB_24650, partial [Streptomyces sp. NPDC001852]